MSEATYQVSLTLGPGQLGVKLNEVSEKWCVVNSITPGGQADQAGFEENDYSIHHSLWHLGAGVAPALVILSSMFKYTQIKWY